MTTARAPRGALRRGFDRFFAPSLLHLLIRGLHATWRVTERGRESAEAIVSQSRSVVLVHWHCFILAGFYALPATPKRYLISRHRDGELIATVATRFAIGAVRASTSSGAAAGLRQVARELAGGISIGITPDGPRGPARVAQPGCVAAARLARVPIIPYACAASAAWRTRSWDQLLIPKPFAQVVLQYGEPVWFDSTESLETGLERLTQALEATERQAQAGLRQ